MSYSDENDDWSNSDPELHEIQGPQFLPGIDAWDRLGLPGGLHIGLVGPGGIAERVVDPLTRFRRQIDAISRNLIDNGLQLNQADITIMIAKAEELNEVGAKNPTAYVLGYFASGGGRELKKDLVKITSAKLSKLEEGRDGRVLLPDVIRYGRLWVLHMK